MDKVITKKLLAWVLTVAMLLTTTMVPSFAAPARNIGYVADGGLDWVKVHDTEGNPPFDWSPTDRPSRLKVTQSDGTIEIDYATEKVPTGAKIFLTYAFSINNGVENGVEPVFYKCETGDYFIISLPEGISFVEASGNLKDSNNEDIDTAWVINKDKLTVTIGTDWQGEVYNKFGEINIEGIFESIEPGEENEETKVKFGSEEIIIKREPLPKESTLVKSGVYDAAANEITWTVDLKVPAGDLTLSYKDYILIDEYSNNQTYKAGSFTLGGESIPDEDLNLLVANTVSYTFTEETSEDQTITYKTTPIDFRD